MKIGHYIPAYNEQVNISVVAQALMDNAAVAMAGHSYRFWGAHSCDLIAMRNQAVAKGMALGLDFLFMQDADVYCDAPGGALMPLIETALATEATLTAAIVSMRTHVVRANTWPCVPGEVFEADKVGSGMILLDLRKMRDWYDSYEGPCFSRVYEDDRCITPKVGSDIFFSYVVRQKGGRIVVNGRIPTVHINGVHRLRFDGERAPDTEAESVAAIGGLESRGVNPNV